MPRYPQGDRSLKQDTREELISILANGIPLIKACEYPNMPCVRSVQNWMAEDPEYDAQITRAREIGYLYQGEKAREDAKTATDASLGRLAFDADRWYLGKMSNAFSDKKTVEHTGKDGALIATSVALVTPVPLAEVFKALGK